MSSVRQLYSQSVIYGLSTVVPRLLNYLLVPLHTTVLTNPEQYGVITEMYAYISFILIFLTFGLETGFFRFSSKFKNDESIYSSIFYFLIFTSSIFLFLFSFFSNNISNSLGSFYKPIYIKTLAGVVCLMPFGFTFC
jgi:O-antigen/teichoic acid export membrane protein